MHTYMLNTEGMQKLSVFIFKVTSHLLDKIKGPRERTVLSKESRYNLAFSHDGAVAFDQALRRAS